MGRFMHAAKVIADAVSELGWQLALIDVVRATPTDVRDVLAFCGEILTQHNEDALAREAYTKLGDVNKLMALFVKRQMWVEAAKLADENEGKFDSSVFLPYAEWLIIQDRCEDAIQAYNKAGRQDLARKILEELTLNAVVETRFKDASYYYWLLAKDIREGTDSNYQLECEHNADLYYAYSSIQSYVTDPFTSQSPELLFQVSRFIINSLGSSGSIPYGISKAATLYTLARQSMILEAYKLARHSYDRLNKLQIPSRWQDEVERDMLIVQAKPVRDNPDQLPSCYRCSSTNPLLNPFTNKFAKGDVCTNCGHPFVRSFINFDILPLVEFVPEPSITDEEAVELIRTSPGAARSPRATNGESSKSGWNEGKVGHADMMTFGSVDSNGEDVMGPGSMTSGPSEELFANCLNKTLENQMNAMSYIPVTVDTVTLLQGMKRSEVFVCRPSSPEKRATFYRNMLPEVVEIAISQSCHRFFHLEDFEFSYLSNKSCPFSRLNDVGEYGSL
ncbi:ift122 [Symbiodinium microadriaticum]|nr:ift122 [Symbiodinium microadriaticum]